MAVKAEREDKGHDDGVDEEAKTGDDDTTWQPSLRHQYELSRCESDRDGK